MSAATGAWEKQVRYQYDNLDNRIVRNEYDGGGVFVSQQFYTYDGTDIAAIAEIFSVNGNVGVRKNWFTLAGTDQLYAVTPGTRANNGAYTPDTTSLYASTDHLGSVRALTDDAGTVVASYDYDSFGNPQTLVDGVPAQPYRYTGRLYDSATGLYNNRAREYDPQLGRFLQEDPIWFNSGDMNNYRYVLSNPVRFTDPSGTSAAEYACEAVHSLGNSITVGANVGIIGNTFFSFLAGTIETAIGNADKAAEIALSAAETNMKLEVTVLSMQFAGLVCGSPSAGPVKPKPPTSCVRKGPNSFSGDTLVWIREQLDDMRRRRIEDLAVGDHVAAWNPVTGGYDFKPVTGKSSRLASEVVLLTLADASGRQETLRTTANHPFLRADQPPEVTLAANDNSPSPSLVRMEPAGLWTAAAKLKAGDKVQAASYGTTPRTLVVASVAVDLNPTRVYSLEVADLHSFAVGEFGAWGHNTRLVPHSKHHKNARGAASPEPPNVEDIFKTVVWDKTGVGWSIDACGNIHRFSRPRNGDTHWNGSTSGRNAIPNKHIPDDIRDWFWPR